MQVNSAVDGETAAVNSSGPQLAFNQHSFGLPTFSLSTTTHPWITILPSAIAVRLTDDTHHSALDLALDAAQWQLGAIRTPFLAGLATSPQVTTHYSPALHLALLTSAGSFVDVSHPLHEAATRAELAQAAYGRVLTELAPVPSLSTVRALGLLATHFGGMPNHVAQAELCFNMALAVLSQVPMTPKNSFDIIRCRASLFMLDVDLHSTPLLTTRAFPIPSIQDLAGETTTDYLVFLCTLDLYNILARAHPILEDATAQAERNTLVSLLQDWNARLPPGLLPSASAPHPLAGTLHITALWAEAVVNGLGTIFTARHFQSAYNAAIALVAASATHTTPTPPVARVLALDTAAVTLQRFIAASVYAPVAVGAARDCVRELRNLQPFWCYASAPADTMERFLGDHAPTVGPFANVGLFDLDVTNFFGFGEMPTKDIDDVDDVGDSTSPV